MGKFEAIEIQTAQKTKAKLSEIKKYDGQGRDTNVLFANLVWHSANNAFEPCLKQKTSGYELMAKVQTRFKIEAVQKIEKVYCVRYAKCIGGGGTPL